MRKIIMFNFVTADGYYAGQNGNIDWHPVDEEFDRYAAQFIQQFDTALFGKVTYDLFAEYWPSAAADESLADDDKTIAQALNEMRKIAVSHSAFEPRWQHTEIWLDLTADRINELKQQDGKHIVIYGSGTIVQQLTDMGMIDEYVMIVAPVILGSGKSLFEGATKRQLNLSDTKVFDSGNVLLHYTNK